MRTLGPLFALLLVLAAGSALYWTDTLRREQPADDTMAAQPRTPDYYFTDFVLHAYDRPGAAGYRLSGTRMTRFAADGAGEVTAPELDYRTGDGPPWRVTSRRARLAPDGDRVDLIDRVVLVQRPRGNADPVIIRTSHLTVFTKAGRAETERRVTADGPGWQMASTGMTAWFERDLIELHGDVEGQHAPGP